MEYFCIFMEKIHFGQEIRSLKRKWNYRMRWKTCLLDERDIFLFPCSLFRLNLRKIFHISALFLGSDAKMTAEKQKSHKKLLFLWIWLCLCFLKKGFHINKGLINLILWFSQYPRTCLVYFISQTRFIKYEYSTAWYLPCYILIYTYYKLFSLSVSEYSITELWEVQNTSATPVFGKFEKFN